MPRLVIEMPVDKIKAGEAEIRRSVKAIGADVKILTSEALKQERSLANLERGIQRVAARYDPAARAAQQFARDQKLLDAALRAEKVTIDEYNALLAKMRERLTGSGAATEKASADFRRLAASLDPAVARTQRLTEAQRTLDAALRAGVITQADHNRYLGLASNSTGDLTGKLGGLRGLIPGVFSVVGVKAFVSSLVEAERKLEQIEKRFLAASGGDRGAAAKEFDFARAEAARLGLQLEATASGYSRLAAASRGTNLEGAETRRIFSAVAEASAALSLSGEDTTGALRAIEQMISKGNVQAEELRGQLGERLPGAFQIAARAIGVTTEELNDMLDRGEVLADELLPRLADELHEAFGEQALENVKSLSGSINQLETAWMKLKTSVGSGEFFGKVFGNAASVVDFLAERLEAANEQVEKLTGNPLMKFLVSGMAAPSLFASDVASQRQAEMVRSAEAALAAMQASVEHRSLRATAFRRTGADHTGDARDEVISDKAFQKMIDDQVKAQEAAGKSAAALQKRYADLVKSLNPVKGALADYAEGLELVLASGAPAAEQLDLITALYDRLVEKTQARQLKELDFERDVEDLRDVDDVLKDILARLGGAVNLEKDLAAIREDALDKMGDEWLEANEEVAKHKAEIVELERAIVDTGAAIAESFAGTQFGDAIASLTQIYDSILAIQTASDKAGKAQGAANFASGVYGLGTSLGIFGPKGGRTQFGGQGEGNYSEETSQVGAVIGAIIGSYYGATMQGAQIGAAAGGIVGSFIKKGADEALGSFYIELGKVTTSIQKSEGGLGGVISDLGVAVDEALGQALSALGGTLNQAPGVSVKVRDNIITVAVGVARAKFESMDDAISFAVAEILKQGQITGMSESVRTAIQNSTKESLESLLSDIDFAISLDRIGMRPVEVAIEDYLAEYRAAVERATRLGLDTSKVGVGLAVNLQSERSALLGIEEDPAERIRRDAQLFNARMQLLQAEETAKLVDLRFRREALAADIQIANAKGQSDQNLLAARIHMVKAEAIALQNGIDIYAGYVDARGRLLQIEGAQLAALDAAIAASEALLDNLPDLISEGDIAKAIARARGGGDRAVKDFGGHVKTFGGLADRWKAAIQDFRQAVDNLKYNEATTALTLREQTELAYADYQTLLARSKTGDVAALEEADDALRRFLELYKTFTGGGQGFLGDFGDIFDQLIKEAEAFAAGPRPQRLRDGNVVFDRRFHENQREQIQTQERHRREAREDVRALTMAVHAGNKQQRELAAALRRNNPDTVQVRRRRAQP
jgi:tape measure domain-containing protein